MINVTYVIVVFQLMLNMPYSIVWKNQIILLKLSESLLCLQWQTYIMHYIISRWKFYVAQLIALYGRNVCLENCFPFLSVWSLSFSSTFDSINLCSILLHQLCFLLLADIILIFSSHLDEQLCPQLPHKHQNHAFCRQQNLWHLRMGHSIGGYLSI